MPIDNDYFKDRQQNNNNKPNGGGNFQPPFETPEFFKNFGKKAGMLYVVLIIIGICVIIISIISSYFIYGKKDMNI